MAESLERIETDSVVDLQLPVDDSLELGAAAEYLEASDIFEDQLAADGNASPTPRGEPGNVDFVADSLDSASATQGTPVSELQQGLLSNLSDRILPSQSDRPVRDFSGVGHLVPSVSGSLPAGHVMARPDVTRYDMSARGSLRGPSETGELLRGLPVSGSSVRIDIGARPMSEEPIGDQVTQGGRGDAPPVATGSLGRLADAGFVANTARFAGHIYPCLLYTSPSPRD